MAFVVAAFWKAKVGEEEKVLNVIKTLTPLIRAEPNNVCFQAHVSPEDSTMFFLYEQYVDVQSYEDHRASPYFKEHVLDYVIDLLETRQVAIYETIDG
ncbi:MAG TPA: antibiotic biosynthesis monooxygenase family protein [Acidimicrobiales bacterium]|nr:antibiotic biosynthesis monooxygenase family protein [Acidimicrobiales bacterium]